MMKYIKSLLSIILFLVLISSVSALPFPILSIADSNVFSDRTWWINESHGSLIDTSGYLVVNSTWVSLYAGGNGTFVYSDHFNQFLNTTNDVIFANMYNKTEVLALNSSWDYTTDTDTHNTSTEMIDAVNISAYFQHEIEWSNILNKFITAVDDVWVYMSGTTAIFNESYLYTKVYNETEVDTLLNAQDACSEITGCIENALQNIVEDTTPQLGGHLYAQNYGLTFNPTTHMTAIDISASNKDIVWMLGHDTDGYGYYWKYEGTGSGDANYLYTYSENAAAADFWHTRYHQVNHEIDVNSRLDFESSYGTQFRDSAIHIESANDGYLDLTADTGIRLHGAMSLDTGTSVNDIDITVVNSDNALITSGGVFDGLAAQDACSEITGCIENAVTNATMNQSTYCSNIDGATSNLCTLTDTDTDTNASTACAASQFLEGDGTCTDVIEEAELNDLTELNTQIADATFYDVCAANNARVGIGCVDILTEAELNTLAEFDTQIGISGSAGATTYWRGDNSWTTPPDTQLTEDEVEAYIFDVDNTANLGMGGYDVLNVDDITFTTDTANHKIYDNATCIIITGDTSTFSIC